LQRKLYDEKESLEVRCVNTSRENEENQQNVKILNDMIITTNKETEDLKSSLELTIGQLSKIRNLNKEVKADFERFNVLKEDERNGLKQQVSCLIDQINELRPPRNEYQSFPSFTDLNSKLTDKEDEINRLMAENINYIEANNSLMDTIQKLGKPIESKPTIFNQLNYKLSPEEMKKELKEKQEENQELSNYIDKVLATIMENCSHLLEIT